jgi:4-alpha-glucanotransferase
VPGEDEATLKGMPSGMSSTDRWGIDARYVDAGGTERQIAPETIARLRELIGQPASDGGAALVVRAGEEASVGPGTLTLEDGSTLEVEKTLPRDLPLGYHSLQGEGGTHAVIVSPGRCRLPARRGWGWAAQLYAARSRESWGIGDLGDLRRLARWSRRELNADFVLVNPLHAVAPTTPQQASPYSPATRRFANPIYLRVEDVPGAADVGASVEALAEAGRRLNSDRRIDRDQVWRLKRGALQDIWAARREDPEFLAWYANADDVRQFAVWSALADRCGPDWRRWPAAYARPDSPDVAAFATDQADSVRFFAWLQWLIRRQIADVTGHISLIQDLPIGVDPGGADAWMWQDLLAAGVGVGAPPDEFNTRGQDWGLPPFIPWRLAEAGYKPFVDAIRATLATGGGLRIDHVMGLFRLWWIPAGADPADGGYVRYPAADLLDIVALESHRAGAVVIGEDLGTVEPGVRETLAERNVMSYRLLWFEEEPPSVWPEKAMGAVTTHDLPTVAGLWDGSDLEHQRELGLEPNEESTGQIADRLAAMGGLEPDAPAHEAVHAAHRLLAQFPGLLLSATLDDAVAEPARPNVPGADRPENWCLALPVPLEDIEGGLLARQIATLLADATGRPTP